MHIFQCETELAASPEEVFAFHENPHNIQKISPSFLQVVEVEANSIAIKDDKFILKLRILDCHSHGQASGLL